MTDQSTSQFTAAENTTDGAPAERGRLFRVEDFALADMPPPAIWERVLTVSARERVSDIHITFDRDAALIGVRLDGHLCPQGMMPHDLGQRLVNHIKVSAGMDPAERRRPQDGRQTERVDDRPIDLRIAVLPTHYGESVAIRIQDREAALLAVDQLGMDPRQYAKLTELISSPSGLVLVSGPTGCGKTTTLYAMLQKLADRSRKIVTVETPIEYDLPGTEQSEVNYRLGVDYAALVRAALRQDPNVIMIGEVRDSETADAVVRAANSGRLVLATTHASHVGAAVESLVALGAHPHFLARSFRGAISQTLVRRLCPYCTEHLEETAQENVLADVRPLLRPDEYPALSLGRGCSHCRHTGYRGRLGIFEVMVADDQMREMINAGRPARDIYQHAVDARKMMTIAQAGKLAALRGWTTIEELVQNVTEVWADEA
jgi:type II secretory ATPase GspE/PulE/Tfp pilus assembly ATPase PilB-like protein